MIMNMPSNDEIGKIKDTLGYTIGKNLLNHAATNQTKSEVEVVVNDDRSITLNGTVSLTDFVNIANSTRLQLPKGEYILSGCPQGGSESTYYMTTMIKTNGEYIEYIDTGEGVKFTIDSENSIFYVCRINIIGGQVYDNLTFYPMIRKASITDNTYEPYRGNHHSSVDVRLDAVESALKSALEWKLITSDTYVNKPSVSYSTLNSLNFRELMVVVTSGAPNATNSIVYGSSIITRNQLPETFTSSHTAHWYVGMNRSKSDTNAGAVDLWFYGSQSKVYPNQTSGAEADYISYYYR
jgi:hypothetical protein